MLFEIKRLSYKTEHINFGWVIGLTWFLFLFTVIPFAWGAEKSSEVNSEVLPHRWSAIRFSNVNQGTDLKVKLQLDGQATVVLVDEAQLRKYPGVARPLYRTVTRNRAIFSIVAPKDGDYYLIVDNRENGIKRKYSLSITARLDLSKNRSLSQHKSTRQGSLALLSQVIKTAFDVDPIHFKMANCDSANSMIREETVFLCQEYLKSLNSRFSNKREINEIILFELMREAGYVLLKRWKYPLINSPNVKDEFATALLLMFGRREAVEIQAKYGKSLEPKKEGRPKKLKEWLSDPFFVKKWQPFLTPKMQTSYLKILKKEKHTWASSKLIERELSRRE